MSAPVLLASPDDRDAWLAARRLGIGASEIAAVMGISPWESPFSLYWRKVNGWDVEANEVMATGTRLEPAIADWFAYEAMEDGWSVEPAGLYAHPDRSWEIATPDRLIGETCPSCLNGAPEDFGCWDCRNTGIGSPPFAVLECKWVAHSWDGWGDSGTDEIPVHYRAQVLWQCDVMSVDEWHLAALGPGGFRAYHGTVDEAELALMRKAGEEFMARIAANDPPAIDSHSATLATLKRLHPDLEDREVEISDELADAYVHAVRYAREADALKQAAEIRLRAFMGSARRATYHGERIATRVISDIAESTRTVAAHRRDYLTPPREKKS